MQVALLSLLFSLLSLSNAQNGGDQGSNGQSGLNPDTSNSGQCQFCTVPEGYTSENIGAPLNVQSQFPPRWQEAHAKASAMLQGWSVEDKVKVVSGTGWMQGRCVGNTAAIPEHNFPGQCMQDAPLGVRFADLVSAFPAGINAAQTFDKKQIYDRGHAMGEEFRGKGINAALGPMTNMGRVAAGGRNWEGFGGDPYLSGIATYQTVKGIQDAGVQAVVKHYIANEQERNRTTSSSNIDDRTMREVYVHPFLRAVQADVASVMCSYNLINGSWAGQNAKTLNGILKTDLGYGGYVMSDWDATHSGVLATLSGLDMDMPGDIHMNGGKTSYFNANLTMAVNNGSLPIERLDDMAQRVLAAWYLVGQDKDYPAVNFNTWGEEGNEHVNVQGEHYKLIREMAASSIVLLENKGALPLKKPQTIGIIGLDMGPSPKGPNGYPDRGGNDAILAMGWGSGTTNFPYLVDPYQAIFQRARQDGSGIQNWFENWDLEGAAKAATGVDVALVGINSDSGEQYITVDKNEGDRNNISAWHNGDELVKAVAAVNNNTVVIVHSVGPMDMEQWIEHPNITAVVWQGIAGQEVGSGLVDVLYGDYNPSGHLPYTIAKQMGDYPAVIDYVDTDIPPETNIPYTEGLFIDYRHFLNKNIQPRYPFGYGLSYTTFDFKDLSINCVDKTKRRFEHSFSRRHARRDEDTWISEDAGDDNSTDASASAEAVPSANVTAAPNGTESEAPCDCEEHSSASATASATSSAESSKPTDGHDVVYGPEPTYNSTIGTSMTDDLHRRRWEVKVNVCNSGSCAGNAVPQLYLRYPEGLGEPPKVFRDFEKVYVEPGQEACVSFFLSRYDVSIWNAETQKWEVPEGEFTALVGRDSFDDSGPTAKFTPAHDL